MESTIVNGLLILKLNMIQTVALALVVYFLGSFIRHRVPIFMRLSIPAPVIGGLIFAGLSTFLRTQGILGFELDGSMQTALMIMFFCTIGMGASVTLLKKGGMPLIIFFLLAVVLGVLQNVLGIALAKATGIDPMFGIISGAVTLMGGLGTGGAFGPLFEEWGVQGATTAAIACATFGMVAGSLMGGPFGETLIKKYKIVTPFKDGIAVDSVEVEEEQETGISGDSLIKTLGFILAAMGLGSILSFYLTKAGITLPGYIGAMIMAAVIRNFGDLTKSYEINGNALEIISEISLAVYLTMAINGLKLWELINLALPLLVILIGQIILMALFCWLVVYFIMGRTYDAVHLSVGMVGFGMGATPNALVNMAALTEKYGPSPRALMIVSLVGAFLIDFANALIITGMAGIYR
ncbi:Sodium/glutamate symport carrier protein [Sporomusa ovata DSM 2662]|uniref:Sodium/glutamate symporter n=1 Tax=Sporomusa ovata TaxID=2378 RepID=A0A0U1KX22_9FIRM|nr:sodium/glutamate symporter [Sporomusa ovata]EQB28281.1 sodium/glutamate symport carrier protein [Sporomusa ovata DSM 2662]CQR71825.1 Sodium/glutamate symporter [Sporomusa ovata]